jgi:hypothetical protein
MATKKSAGAQQSDENLIEEQRSDRQILRQSDASTQTLPSTEPAASSAREQILLEVADSGSVQ